MGVGAIAPALGGVGLLTGIAGAAVQAHAEGIASAAKVQQDQTNQQLALGQAESVLQRGSWEANQANMRGDQVVGQERAGYGASGVDANSGSAAQMQAQSRALSGLDAKQAMLNASQQAWGYQVTANQYGTQAGVDKQLGQDQQTATWLGAAGGVASGAGSLLGKAGPTS